MEKTAAGTSVGVEDPYAHVDRCDYLTDEGKCRYAVENGDLDPAFARERRAEEYQCPVAGSLDAEGLTGPWEWEECPHFCCRNRDRECIRCGLEEQRMAHDSERPLLEEHHLSYSDARAKGERVREVAGDGESYGNPEDDAHEITVYLCRWCHAKVHKSWARIDDDVNSDPEAIAVRESRRAKQEAELSFDSAADRFGSSEDED